MYETQWKFVKSGQNTYGILLEGILKLIHGWL